MLQKRYLAFSARASLRAKEKSLNANCVQTQPGADDGTRTRGLLITNELLYQLSYISDSNIIAKNAAKVKQFGAKYFAPNPLQYFV